jgi:FkbM family methyltransferase
MSAIPALAIVGVACDNAFGHEGWWSASWGRFFGVVKVRTKATGGEIALIDTHDLGQLVSCEELLVERTYDLSLVPFQPDLIVDCGSHIGLFSLISGFTYPLARLIAYEPEPKNFRVAQKQLARFDARLRLVEAAVSTTNGESWFSSSMSNSGHLTTDEEGVVVKTVDLAADAESWRTEKLLIKMDIEGAEEQVLPHLINHLPRKCALFLETHGGNDVGRRLSYLLTTEGFAVSTTRVSGPCINCFGLRV